MGTHLLQQQSHWTQVGSPHRCQCGHALSYQGSITTGTMECSRWSGCIHPLAVNFDSPMGIYYCSKCSAELCEPCVSQLASWGQNWPGIPAQCLPRAVTKALTMVNEPILFLNETLGKFWVNCI